MSPSAPPPERRGAELGSSGARNGQGESDDLRRQSYNHTAEQQPDAGLLESGKEDRPGMDPVRPTNAATQVTS